MRAPQVDALPLEVRRRRPARRAGLVARPRLLKPLLAATERPLALIVAPAGYGKTTLLSQWAAADRRPFAWLTLDEADNDPDRLVAAIAGALDAVTGPRDERPFVLALDDVHVLTEPAALRAVGTIAGRLPPGAQLALASRDEPRIPVGRMRADGGVVELRAADLVMTPSEGAALIRSAGVSLDDRDLHSLVQRTEGWAAGLYLASLSLLERPAPGAAAKSFGGDDRLVSEYLRDEVLATLSEDHVRFLTMAAAFEPLTGPMCDVILERSDSGRVLEVLERSNVMVRRGDDGRYRYLRPLRQSLEAQLARTEPDLARALNGRAARWHAARGDVDRAMDHAVAARDPSLVGRLLWTNLLRYTAYGRTAAVERWLGRLTEEEIAADPALALAAAGTALVRGDRNLVERWTSTASLSRAAADQDLRASLEAGILVLRAAVGIDGPERILSQARAAYDLLEDDDPWRSLCCFLIGSANHLSGDRETARRTLEEGARRGGAAAPGVQALCLAQLALLAVDEEDGADAKAYAARARAQINRFAMPGQPASALVLAVSAAAHADSGRVDKARSDVRAAVEVMSGLTDAAGWYETEVRVALARASLRLGDMAAARSELAEASRLIRCSPQAPVLADWTRAAWQWADSAIEHSTGDRWSLTTAELRVMQFLPTHLSLPAIATRLNVTVNTVKTHTRAIYRKLDASSRAEAVVRARESGLVQAEVMELAEAA